MSVTDWLIDADPAIRWQALRDLTDAPPTDVAAERARVATEGWGAQLLALRDPDGQWAGGACFPGRSFIEARQAARAASDAQAEPATEDDSEGDKAQPWISTLPTLQLLQNLGVDPQASSMRETIGLIAKNCRWEYDDLPYFDGEVEPCINGRTVAQGAYFGQDVAGIVDRLLGDQLEDGGWNCATEQGSTRSSFHSTIDVLEGLLEHERATGGSAAAVAARRRGEEYLLERELIYRKSTGTVVDPTFLEFSFPTWWHYDALRALDYFRAVGGSPDPRVADAVELVRRKQQSDGRWQLDYLHPGLMHFALEDGEGRPSRWVTLRALRVLRWYDAAVA
ncbi:MAG: squalene cyclase [Mycobacteriales bacterium]